MNWRWWGIWGHVINKFYRSFETGDYWGKTMIVVRTHAYIPCTTVLESNKAKGGCEPWLGKFTSTSRKFVIRGTQSWSWNIFLKACVPCDYKEKEKTMLFEVIWSLGATSFLMQSYFKVEVKSSRRMPTVLWTFTCSSEKIIDP